jgi:hypothetical protein
MESGEEGFAQLVVAGGNATEVFDLVEKAFHAVAFLVEGFVLRELFAAGAHRGNDGLHAVQGQAFADAVGVIAFVQRRRLQDVVRIKGVLQTLKLAAIMGLAFRQVKGCAATFIDRGGMNLGAQSPARAAQSLVRAVFFGAPAACCCARTVVESMKRWQAWAKRSD